MNGLRIRPSGDRALLVDLDTLDAVVDLHAVVDATRHPAIVDVVPAACTVLVVIDPTVAPVSTVRTWLEAAAAAPAARRRAIAPVTIDVTYDGADLGVTAELLGVSVAQLVERHTAAEWSVAFCGFVPGFAYLVSEDWPFEVPRLDAPRTRVPAGAVGLAGEFGGIYPRESPGGWRLIGQTHAVLWATDAQPPALLAPGARVRFRRAS